MNMGVAESENVRKGQMNNIGNFELTESYSQSIKTFTQSFQSFLQLNITHLGRQ